MADSIRVRVVYALRERQATVELKLDAGATVAEAVQRSALVAQFPEMAERPLHCAVFGRVVALTDVLHDADRVEILRPLIADPKENRRAAAARNPVGRFRK